MIEPISLLTDDEIYNIGRYIRTYGGPGGYNMDCGCAEIPYLLRFWNREKPTLTELFGGKLIVEKEIDIDYPRSLLVEDLEDRLYNPRLTFVNDFWCWLEKQRFFRDNYALYADLSSLMSLDTLCDNIYDPVVIHEDDNHNHLIPVPGKKPLALNPGCKVMKFLAKLADAFDLNGFEEFRIAHSMALNKKRFKGTLCVSIHPLDYMTMSDNDCDWDSCMSWQKPGEYRQGTVEVMNSDNMVVAYLKSHTDMKLWGGTDAPDWNNKRWRELFIVQEDCMSGIRGYPYCDDLLESQVELFLRELMLKNKPEWAWEETPSIVDAGETCTLNCGLPIRVHIYHGIMYDDYGYKQRFYAGPSLYPKIQSYPRYEISISGATECMCCGDNWSDRLDNFNEEYVMCPSCCGEYTCSECGDYVSEENTVFFADDEDLIVCRHCAETIGEVCEECQDWHHTYNIDTVYMRHMDEVDDCSYIHLCNWCLNNSNITDEIGPIEYKPISPRHYGNRYQADSRNFTRRGYQAFGIYSIARMNQMQAEIASVKEDN